MSERYQREIEEILRQTGDLKTPRPPRKPRRNFWRLVRLYIGQSLGGRGWSLSPGRVMLIAVSLLLAALIIKIPLLAWAGLLLFIVGYGMFFVKPPKTEKRWRGQPLDIRRDSLWDRLRRKLR